MTSLCVYCLRRLRWCLPFELMAGRAQFVELKAPVDLDTVSDLRLERDNLLVSSWDNRILIYDCSNETRLATEIRTEAPPISLYALNHYKYVGLLDGTIKELDLENLKLFSRNLSGLDLDYKNGINNICGVDHQPNSIIASSILGKLQLIDNRNEKSILINLGKNKKIFTMDSNENILTVGLSDKLIEFHDIRNIGIPFETRELGLKYQIIQLKSFPNQEGFAISTVDGRVSMEYYDSSPEVQAMKKFTFKCHRFHDKTAQLDIVYPINSINFNKQFGTLFTAGSDGALCLWDVEKRKRMKLVHKFDDPIMKIDSTNNLIAVATSDDSFHRIGENTTMNKKPSRIFIKTLSDTECMPIRARPQ